MIHDMFYVYKTNVKKDKNQKLIFCFFLQKTRVEEKL